MTMKSASEIKRITCIGGGPIGGGWSAHFLARGYQVTSYIHEAGEEQSLRRLIDTAWSSLSELGVAEGASPGHGEIVIFDSPESGVRLIKRVVAVAGDTVEVHAGKLTINGVRIESDTAADLEMFGARQATLNMAGGGGPDMEPTVVPPGTVMVMGDNRGNSRDSRAFGFIPVGAIYGHAVRLYYRRGNGFVWRPI